MDTNRKNFTFSAKVKPESVKELFSSLDEEKSRIHQEFKNSFEEFYKLNENALANDKYPDEFRDWIKKVSSEIWFFACNHGWNKCYEYHEDYIKKGLEEEAYGDD